LFWGCCFESGESLKQLWHILVEISLGSVCLSITAGFSPSDEGEQLTLVTKFGSGRLRELLNYAIVSVYGELAVLKPRAIDRKLLIVLRPEFSILYVGASHQGINGSIGALNEDFLQLIETIFELNGSDCRRVLFDQCLPVVEGCRVGAFIEGDCPM
jgi:hypothetical protein